MLPTLGKYFFRGLIVVAPVAVTFYLIFVAIVFVDGWIDVQALVGRRIPGAGLVITLAAITLVGFLATNFALKWLVGAMDRFFGQLPLVKLLYTSIKDLIGAFVGEHKRFDRPVLVTLGDGFDASVLGFLTREGLAELGASGHVAVYVPQSYNFAGQLLVVPASRVRELAVESKSVMTFVVSGGVTGLGDAAEDAPGATRAGVPAPQRAGRDRQD
jgi:uncharacterized membrane protein